MNERPKKAGSPAAPPQVTFVTEEEPSPEFGCLIPVSLRRRAGKTEIACLEELLGFARRFADEYAPDLFSDAALGYLYREMGLYGKKRGYAYEDAREELVYRHFILTAEEGKRVTSAIGDPGVIPKPVRLTRSLLKKENLTGFDFGELLDNDLCGYVTLLDGKIVSAACDNFGDGLCEAAIETAEDYRRKGYAYANALALIAGLAARGQAVSYVCGQNNAPSIALARKLGFREDGESFYCVLYEEE